MKWDKPLPAPLTSTSKNSLRTFLGDDDQAHGVRSAHDEQARIDQQASWEEPLFCCPHGSPPARAAASPRRPHESTDTEQRAPSPPEYFPRIEKGELAARAPTE